MKLFTNADIVRDNHIMISSFRKELTYCPPKWMAAGLQETASGYGMRLNSGWKINFNNKLYRVYITQISNASSAWFTVKGKTIYVS